MDFVGAFPDKPDKCLALFVISDENKCEQIGHTFTRITPYIYSHLGNCIGSNDVDRGRRLDSIRPSLLALVILSLVRMLQIGASQP